MSYEDEILAESPIFYWRLGESSGTTADNYRGNSAFDGTVVGSPTMGVPGLVDGDDTAYDFDGTNDLVWVEDNIDVTETGYSVEVWCEPDDVSLFRNIAGKQDEIPPTQPGSWSRQLRIVGDPFNTFDHVSVINNVERTIAGTTEIEAGKRYHVVGTCSYVGTDGVGNYVDATTIRIYVNGVLEGEATYSGGLFDAVSYWNLGGPGSIDLDVLDAFDGVLDEFVVYPAPLSPERVLANYEAGRALQEDAAEPAGDFGAGVGVPSPLSFSIRPADGGPLADITAERTNEQWEDNAIGGFGSCSFDIPRQDWENDTRIRRWSDVVIKDGEVSVYEGRIEEIKRNSSADGSYIHVEAFGHARDLDDDMYRGMRSDRSLRRWRESVQPEDAAEVIQDVKIKRYRSETYGPAIMASNVHDDEPDAGETFVANASDRFQIRYDLPDTWRGGIKRLQFQWKASLTSAKRALRVRSYDPNADEFITHYEQTWTTAEQEVNITDFPDDVRIVWIQMIYMLEDVKEISKGWVKIYGPDTRGPVVWSAIDDGRAHKIIHEVVSKTCPSLDRHGVKETSFVVEDVDFTQPVYPRTILDEMPLYGPDTIDDPDWYWQVRERLTNGRYRLIFDEIPDHVSYEVSGAQIDGLGGDGNGLRNKAILQYTDAEGFEQEIVVTQDVDELDAVGLTRTITYGRLDIRTDSRAQRIAGMLLKQHKFSMRSGTITVIGEQVRDAKTHVGLPCWKLRTPRWIRLNDFRVAGRTPKQTRQHNVFLITKIQFSEGGSKAVLTLDNSPNRADVLLARLAARRD